MAALMPVENDARRNVLDSAAGLPEELVQATRRTAGAPMLALRRLAFGPRPRRDVGDGWLRGARG